MGRGRAVCDGEWGRHEATGGCIQRSKGRDSTKLGDMRLSVQEAVQDLYK